MRLLLCLILGAANCVAAEHRIDVKQGQDLQEVIAQARDYRKSHPEEPIRIVVNAGRYELKEVLQLGPEDSNLTFAAAPNAKVVISGGRQIKNWKRNAKDPHVWEASVPEAREGKWKFNQLFINGERKIRARTPNTGYFRVDGAASKEGPLSFKYKGNDIKAEWAKSGEVELIAYFAWADIRMPIRAVDAREHKVVLSKPGRPSNQENNAQYYIENAPDALDSPGEWYLDRASGVVKYLAEENEDLSNAEVFAPVLDQLITIQGDAAKNNLVRNLKFEGIEFTQTDWKLPKDGYADTQAAVEIHGDIQAEFAEDCSFKACRFTHLGGYGLELGRGCKRFVVQGNEMSDLGGGGIRIGEGRKPENSIEENNSHVVTDNQLRKLGRVFAPAVGIIIMQSGTNRVAHNEISDLYYTAISVGWNWGYQETPCRENIVEFNHLHHIGQNLLSDMGGIYTLGIQQGTVLRNNLIHDVSAFTYGGWGLYTDEGSSGILLENNVVYRCKSAGFHQHYGKDNIVRNNIFAFNVEHELMRTREEGHTSFIFTNNIVYFNSGDLLGSNWSNDHYVMDNNIYYDERLGENQAKMKFAGASLEEWRKRGHDQHSLLANPGFVNAAKQDFRLTPDSPAHKIGFQQIDLSSVGPRKAADWK